MTSWKVRESLQTRRHLQGKLYWPLRSASNESNQKEVFVAASSLQPISQPRTTQAHFTLATGGSQGPVSHWTYWVHSINPYKYGFSTSWPQVNNEDFIEHFVNPPAAFSLSHMQTPLITLQSKTSYPLTRKAFGKCILHQGQYPCIAMKNVNQIHPQLKYCGSRMGNLRKF